MPGSNENIRRGRPKEFPTAASRGRRVHKENTERSSPGVKTFKVPELFPQQVAREEIGPGFTYSQPYVSTHFLSPEQVGARRVRGEQEGDAFAADQALRRVRHDEEEAIGDRLGRRR